MAVFNPFNGDSQPVFALDVNNGPQTGNIAGTDALVQMQGPKLDFFKVIVENGSNQARDLRTELGVYTAGVFDPGVVKAINQAIQTKATIAMYQVEGAATGQISYALYPQDAYDATTLTQLIQGLGTITITKSDGTTRTVDVSGSDATEPGFQLA